MSLHENPLRVLTVDYPQIVHILRSELRVAPVPIANERVMYNAFTAIWDTGATNTVISRAVIDEFALTPIGITMVNTSRGIHRSYAYLISLELPSNVRFPVLRVTEGSIVGADVLLGMDVITQGDFVVTNAGGRTMFSFRVPALAHIDFGISDYGDLKR